MSQHRPRAVIAPRPLARWGTYPVGFPITAQIVIDIQGVDPRLVLVPSVWVERVAETSQEIASGVTWSAFSAVRNNAGALLALHVLDGCDSRPVRPIGSHRGDGIYTQGDNLELQASTPLLLAIACAEHDADFPDPYAQTLWFALDAFPADPACTAADFDRMLQDVRCDCPPEIQLQGGLSD